MNRENNKSIFPDPSTANKDGLLAIGGDLSTSTLLDAYSKGIFPWFNESSPILWWSPDPRLILLPEEMKVSKSLARTIKSGKFEYRTDSSFEEVIDACSGLERKGQEGTWITNKMKQAYIELHRQGYAHSVESFYNGRLVGGLYGVSLGAAFFGESMFQTESDASKAALHRLVQLLKEWEFDFIDAQVPTDHLKRMGAKEISRRGFIKMLEKSLEKPSREGIWEY